MAGNVVFGLIVEFYTKNFVAYVTMMFHLNFIFLVFCINLAFTTYIIKGLISCLQDLVVDIGYL